MQFSHYHGPSAMVVAEVGSSVESWHMHHVPLHFAQAETAVLPRLPRSQMGAVVLAQTAVLTWLQMAAVVFAHTAVAAAAAHIVSVDDTAAAACSACYCTAASRASAAAAETGDSGF